jgi:hypothetical protein
LTTPGQEARFIDRLERQPPRRRADETHGVAPVS